MFSLLVFREVVAVMVTFCFTVAVLREKATLFSTGAGVMVILAVLAREFSPPASTALKVITRSLPAPPKE